MLIKYLSRGILYNDVQKSKIHCDGRRDEGQSCPGHSSIAASSDYTQFTNPVGSITASLCIRYSFVSLRFVRIAVVSCSAEWPNQCRDQFIISVVFDLKKNVFFMALISNIRTLSKAQWTPVSIECLQSVAIPESRIPALALTSCPGQNNEGILR